MKQTLLVAAGLLVVALAVLLIIGSIIPQYQIEAMETRNACRKVALPELRHRCEEDYVEAMARKQASFQRIAP